PGLHAGNQEIRSAAVASARRQRDRGKGRRAFITLLGGVAHPRPAVLGCDPWARVSPMRRRDLITLLGGARAAPRAARAAGGANVADRCFDGESDYEVQSLGRGVSAGTREARVDGGPKHRDNAAAKAA